MPTQVTIDTNLAETEVTITTNDASTNYTISAGARGPQGLNSITTSTTTNITGIIKGNGSVVSQAVAGTDYATAAQGTLADGAAQKSANLSDLGSAATARTNLVLGNVNNTSDANKPVSTAQQTALDLKANLASPTFTGTPTLPTGTIGTTQNAGNNSNALATTAFVTESFSNPITQGGTIIQVPATALQRSTVLNGGTSLISNLTSPTPRVTCTTTLDSSAVLRAVAADGVTTRCDSSARKLFGDKYGWFLIGYFGARGVGSRTKVIIGGNSTPAEMIVEGTLGSDGISLESQPLVTNTPRFRLVVRNGATTTVGAFSGTGVYNIGQLGQWWIVMESGTTNAYYRIAEGTWNLICSVAAVPASSTVVSGNGIAIVAYTPDSGAAAGSTAQLNIIYETFGITPD